MGYFNTNFDKNEHSDLCPDPERAGVMCRYETTAFSTTVSLFLS